MATVPADKQIVLIIGGSQGIGLGLVESLLNGTGADFINKDCIVVATGRDVTKAEKLTQLQSQDAFKDRLYTESIDVSESASIKAFIQTFLGKYPRLDVLFYNAGTVGDSRQPGYELIDADAYYKNHLINVIGPQHVFFGLKELLNKTHELLGGKVGEKPTPRADDAEKDDATKVRIIFISSSMGSMETHQYVKYPIYRTSKSALNHICRDIHLNFPHFGTFIVHPGYVRTQLTGWNGDISVEESAQGIHSILTKDAYAVNSTKWLLSYNGTRLGW